MPVYIKFGEEFRMAVESIPPSEIQSFFESLRQREYTLISTDLPLTDIRPRVKLLNELEQLFVAARKK